MRNSLKEKGVRECQEDSLFGGCLSYQLNGVIPVAVTIPFHRSPCSYRAGGNAEPTAITFGEIDLGSRICQAIGAEVAVLYAHAASGTPFTVKSYWVDNLWRGGYSIHTPDSTTDFNEESCQPNVWFREK